MDIREALRYLKEYDGPEISVMEICGSHTEAIAKSGIRDVISKKIRLISGPGCPVCVCPSGYVDRLIGLSMQENTSVVTFGDLIRIPGKEGSLQLAKGRGASVELVYSPMDTIKLALANPERNFVFGAVGFETTIPVYPLLLEQAAELGLGNLKLLTALKRMPPAIDYLCQNGARIDAFLAPGHVSTITGSDAFCDLSLRYRVPFGVTGFSEAQLVMGLYGTVKMVLKKEQLLKEEGSLVKNFYPSVVTKEGNRKAQEKMAAFFEPGDAVWRGMGVIPDSGLYLRREYAAFDAGSRGLTEDEKTNPACRCGEVLMGKMDSSKCPLFGRICNPETPQGACMVSTEGSCYQNYLAADQRFT